MSLQEELVGIVFEVCDVKDHTPEELGRHDPLIGPESPLGLDSLDALEIVVAVGKRYGVRIAVEQTAIRVLRSLDTLIEYVEANRTR